MNTTIREASTKEDLTQQGITPTPPGNTPTINVIDKLKILFLDVDGVLNSHKIQVITKNLAFPDIDREDLGYVLNAESTDRMAADLVNTLCETTGAFIVVSSSWRLGTTLPILRKMLSTLGVNPNYIIGRTISLDNYECNRGLEIDHFLKELKTIDGRKGLIDKDLLCTNLVLRGVVVVESFAIIDDDNDFTEYQVKNNFVQTTFMDGLTCALTLKLGRILSNDETFYLNRLRGLPSAGGNNFNYH